MTQELLTLEEAMRKLMESGRVLVPGEQSWWVQDEATYEEANPRPAISEASWPEACSVEWGVPVVARDDAAELRAALKRIHTMFSSTIGDSTAELNRKLVLKVPYAMGIARQALEKTSDAALAASEGES